MQTESKAVAINLRVTPEYRARLKRCVTDFGMSLSEVMAFGLNYSMAIKYEALIKHLQKLEADLVDGPRKKAVRKAIKSAKQDEDFFTQELADLPEKSKLYAEIESLEAYRDFLSETVTETVTAKT